MIVMAVITLMMMMKSIMIVPIPTIFAITPESKSVSLKWGFDNIDKRIESMINKVCIGWCQAEEVKIEVDDAEDQRDEEDEDEVIFLYQ